MNRAFHTLTIRTVDEGQRIIEGWASTGRTDRVGDIVEPLGAEFDLPLPLLLDHDHSLAVGEVEKAEVTSQGVRFVARIKKISEPGKAKELTDMAWHYARHGLRKCVSIGFQPLEYEPLKSGGSRFTRWSWYELSLCTVPANPDAVIETVKRGPLPASIPRERPVRLTREELVRGKLQVEADRRHAVRRKLGISRVVQLDAVDLLLTRAHRKRQERARRAKHRNSAATKLRGF